MLGICGATTWELRPVLGTLRDVRRTTFDGVRAWRGRYPGGAVLVFRTGIGPGAASRAAAIAVERASLSALLNTGLAGGLAAHLTAGDLVVPEFLITPSTSEPTRWLTDPLWTGRLRAVAATAGLTTDSGPIVTWPVVLSTKGEKRRAAEQYGATAVEMEGSALAEIAAQQGIPFASVRAILDDANTHLPRLGRTGYQPNDASPPPGDIPRPGAREKISSFLALAQALRRSQSVLSRFFRALNIDVASELV
jgi:nucleoside phosphorylase